MAADPPKPNSDFTTQKKVDESWKDSVRKEKESTPFQEDPGGPGEAAMPEASFSLFISTLGMQALAALGEIAHPSTGEKAVELGQAQYLIDVIQMLSDKTQGRRTAEETSMLENLLYELRMKFVQKKGVE